MLRTLSPGKGRIVQSDETVVRAIAILAAAASRHGGFVQGTAAHALGELVAGQLWREGHAGAWEDFMRDPANDLIVRYLVQQAVERDAGFRTRLGKLIQTASNPAVNYGAPGWRTHHQDHAPGGHRVTYRSHRRSRTRAYLAAGATVTVLGLAALLFKAVPMLSASAEGGSRAPAHAEPSAAVGAGAALSYGATLTAPGQPGSAVFSFGRAEAITSPAQTIRDTGTDMAALASCSMNTSQHYPYALVEMRIQVTSTSSTPEKLGFNVSANDDTNYLLNYPSGPSCEAGDFNLTLSVSAARPVTLIVWAVDGAFGNVDLDGMSAQSALKYLNLGDFTFSPSESVANSPYIYGANDITGPRVLQCPANMIWIVPVGTITSVGCGG